jgi:3-hydroxyacyl-[acyl-carrier-protein] dehydratase
MTFSELYKIETFQLSEDRTMLEATILINSHHDIFNGHFPGNPILPGVCHIEIICDLLQLAFDRNFTLSKAKNIKFLNVVQPEAQPKLIYRLDITDEGNAKSISGSSKFPDGTVNLKLSSTFAEL